jgi:ribosome-binding protein aMBF1 (putative translation factor)
MRGTIVRLPTLPKLDAKGNYPAIPYARASLARKLIRRRCAAGLTQEELAKRAKVRLETLRRIERAEYSPDVSTVEEIVRALEIADARASSGKRQGGANVARWTQEALPRTLELE